MQVSVSQSGKLERKMKVEVAESEIVAGEEKRFQKLTKKVKMDGFRKGKVPLKVIRERYGPQVRHEVLGDVIQSSLVNALAQEKLNPVGMPRIEETQFEQGQPLTYTAIFEVYPEVTLKPFKEIKVEKPVAEVNDADIENTLQEICKQYKNWTVIERAAKNDDQVDIDFVGSIDGVEFAGGKAENFKLELNAGNMIPGFTEGIVGMQAGEEKTIDVDFPKEYGQQDLAGKQAQFLIKVNAVAEASLPELDDELAKRLGIKEGGLVALRKEVKKNMQRELVQGLKTKVKQQVMEALLAKNELELPKSAVTSEVDRLQKQAEKMYGEQTNVDEIKNKGQAVFAKEAERRVALGLLVAEIVKQYEIKIDASRVRKMIEEIADAYEKPADVIKNYYGDKKQLANIEALVLEDQVIEKILVDATVSEKQTSFAEIIKPGPR